MYGALTPCGSSMGNSSDRRPVATSTRSTRRCGRESANTQSAVPSGLQRSSLEVMIASDAEILARGPNLWFSPGTSRRAPPPIG